VVVVAAAMIDAVEVAAAVAVGFVFAVYSVVGMEPAPGFGLEVEPVRE